MTLDTFLDALPCEIDGYALRITRYYDSDEQAEMWEIAYTDDKGKCMYSTTAQSLEVAVYKAIPQLIDMGFGRKNCADCTNDKGCVTCVGGNMAETEYPKKGSKNCDDCVIAEYPPCNKGIPCCKCGDECNSRQPCPKKGGEK